MKLAQNIRVMVFTGIAFIVVAACSAQKAGAIDLYNNDDIITKLKKNQLMSEKDINEIRNSYPKLELMGSLQLQYSNSKADSGSDRISDMFLRRANLRIVGHVSDKASFVFEPEYGRGEPSIKDAYFEYKHSMFEVFAGNHKLPFSAEALKSDIYLPFVERHLTSQIAPDRLPGASISAKALNSRLIVQAGVWNSNLNSKAEAELINNKLADNSIFSTNSGTTGSNILVKAARIAYYSNGRDDFYAQEYGQDGEENFSNGKSFGVGLSYFDSSAVNTDLATNGLTGLNGANAIEGDVLVRIWRVTGEFEYAKRNLDWWQYNFAQTSSVAVSSVQTSYSAQASILVTPNLSLSLRQESFTYDNKDKVLKGAHGQDKDKWLTTGLNYYFKEQHTKLQANYISKDSTMPKGVDASKSNEMLLQVTTYF